MSDGDKVYQRYEQVQQYEWEASYSNMLSREDRM